MAKAESCHSFTTIDWLLGSWISNNEKQVITESWQKVSPTTVEGKGTTFSMGKQKSSESLRIVEMSGALFYLAKVNHNPLPIAFKLITCTNESVIFENMHHDFPKRIEYAYLQNEKMKVIVSDGKNKKFSIHFKRKTR